MQVPMPANETERVAALRSYHIMDTPPEAAYNELAELAADFCECPIAVIGLIDEQRDWLKAKYGLRPELMEVPREMNICATTICGSDILIVPDLKADQRFSHYPVVDGPPHLRFYCGMPLITPEGYALGTLCVFDIEPREIRIEQTEAIRRLAHQVSSQLEYRRSLIELQETMGDLEVAQRELEAERTRSEDLLHKILPSAVAQELKRQGRVAPRFFDSATVMFVDFEGFTHLAARIEPRGLVDQLDQYFSAFDQIAERHRLEMLKTIGDAYMCVGGLPEPGRSHPVNTALAAFEILDYMERTNRQRERLRLPRWELRIGMHTGPVMAGVVGRRKFAYDVWGDAVNVASRMESTGAAGRINVSESVAHHLKALFDVEPRGAIEAKNKGELSMFFLTRIKPELARDEAGRVPNERFHEQCARIVSGYVAAQ